MDSIGETHTFIDKNKNQVLGKFDLSQKQIKVSTQARIRSTNLMQRLQDESRLIR